MINTIFQYSVRFFLLLASLTTTGSLANASQQKEGVFQELWREAGTLPGPRSDFGSFLNKNNIYLIGGTDNTSFLKTVFSGKVSKDGEIGNWQELPPLKSPRSFFATVVHHDSVYVLGGSTGTYNEFLLNTVERAKLNPDGSLSKWEIEQYPLPNNSRCLKAAVYGRHIYTVGGWNGSMMNSVARAVINENGSLGKWEILPPRTIYPRYIHSLLLAQNTLFVMGGHDVSKGSGMSNIEYANINEAGEVEKWALTSPLPEKLFGNAMLKHDNNLILVGGRNKHKLTKSVFIGTIDLPSKKISNWRRLPDLETPLEHASAFLYNANLFVMGGSNKRGARKTIYKATLTVDGKLGNYLSKNESRAIKQFNGALDAFSRGDLNGAISQFLESIRLDPKMWDAYYNLGLAYMMNDQPDKTITLMEQVIDMNGGYEDSYLLLAIVYDKREDADKTITYLNQAIDKGFGDMNFIINTPDLKNVRSDQRFEKLIEGYSSSTFMF